MARKRISMKKMRDVIRLKMSNELSDQQIARALNISRPVVAKYWKGFQSSGLKFEQIETMADSKLLQILEKRPVVQNQKCDKYKKLAEYFPYLLKELKRAGKEYEKIHLFYYTGRTSSNNKKAGRITHRHEA